MAHCAIGKAAVAQPTFKLRRVGKAAINFAIPNKRIIHFYLINTLRAGYQRDGRQIGTEGTYVAVAILNN